MTSGCPSCRSSGRLGVLEVAYDLAARLDGRSAADFISRAQTFWDFAALLPVDDPESRIDLGQGFTPLVAAARDDGPNLHFKLEAANPTWSFKDRYTAVSVSIAQAFGHRRVVASSTGNLAASVAAFAARADLEAVVFCPAGVSAALVAQISSYGAQVVLMNGEDRLAAMENVGATGQVFPVGLFIAWPVSNPFGVEGYKTIAYELYRQLGEPIDAVVFPCARGNGLYGTWKGFCELRELGLIRSVPRMIAVQPDGAASLPAAFAAGASTAARVDKPQSIAMSIRERVASDDALRAIYGSEGMAVSVSDAEILAATRQLAAEGLCVELASGAAYAGVQRLSATGTLDREHVVACVLTSSGIKWPSDLKRSRGPVPKRVAKVADAVAIAVGRARGMP